MLEPPYILIVDDEPNVRLLLRTALESAGYRVHEAPDGLAALSSLQARRYDLVVLDLRMPNLDGMQTLAKLRERGNPAPVVLLTAHGSIPDAVAAMRLGAIDFLTKPITPGELRSSVADVIVRIASRPESAAAPAPSNGFEPARAKRAVNRGKFEEAEGLLREILATTPDAEESRQLLNRLLLLKLHEGQGSFSMLREWFPGSMAGDGDETTRSRRTGGKNQ
jgi:DNA-binding response OmpR family regulator